MYTWLELNHFWASLVAKILQSPFSQGSVCDAWWVCKVRWPLCGIPNMSKTRKWASYHLFTIADVPKVDLSQAFAPFCVIHTSRLCLEAQPVLLRKEGAPPLECLLLSSHTTVVRGCLVYFTPTSFYVHMGTGPLVASSIIVLFMAAANGLVFLKGGFSAG